MAFWDLNSSLIVNGVTYTLVGDVASLHAAAQSNAGGHYALANNYDAGPDGTYTVAPVGVLGGSFEGLGNTIDNLRIRIPGGSSDRYGLIAWLQPAGAVRAIALTHVEIVQAETTGLPTTGALVGSNQGMVLTRRLRARRCAATSPAVWSD
ncbi:MAG: hypothetical protein JOZ72_03095 [Alphaproteobacteria bacterium]|nr:hypothetical protein [Alphaproteobacteria bacterium]